MKLLESIKVGNIEFKNRIMFPPLTTGYEEKDCLLYTSDAADD